jgi:hypothetical protein
MAIPLGTNDLKIYRRHASYCTRYPSLKNKPDTYRPSTKKDAKTDTCNCPIWWLDITASKLYDWRERYGKVNEHNGWVSRDFWLEDWEKQAIIG